MNQQLIGEDNDFNERRNTWRKTCLNIALQYILAQYTGNYRKTNFFSQDWQFIRRKYNNWKSKCESERKKAKAIENKMKKRKDWKRRRGKYLKKTKRQYMKK